MMESTPSRRQLIQQSAALLGVTALLPTDAAPAADDPVGERRRPRYSLNTSTIRGPQLNLPQKIQLTAQAGYDAIEPWTNEVRQHLESGGRLPDLRQQIQDAGLTVESAIGFSAWIIDDDAQRAQGMESMKRDMDLLRQIGGKRIAAPPAGATENADLNLMRAAERYRELLELGRSLDVTPQLELWGFSQSLSRLGELMFVAMESAHPDACLLPDVFHIYKGGSDFSGLRLVDGKSIHVFHLNDYPGDIPRERVGDADRVYPGDGVAPLPEILRNLFRNGFNGTLSLELFNRQYWQQDALEVARTGLRKMQQAVATAHRF